MNEIHPGSQIKLIVRVRAKPPNLTIFQSMLFLLFVMVCASPRVSKVKMEKPRRKTS